MLDLKEVKKQISKHYSLPFIKDNLARYMYNREFSLLTSKLTPEIYEKASVRNIRGSKRTYLEFWFKFLNVIDSNKFYNLYYSLAQYKHGMPYVDPNNFKGRNLYEWNKKHQEEIISYDFVIDIDAEDYETMKYAKQDLIKITNMLNKVNCPYYPRFSGLGFHIIIPYRYFSQFNNYTFNSSYQLNIYRLYSDIAAKISQKYSDMVDLKIYDSRRLLKLPSSIAIYEDNIQLARPLYTQTDINEFDYNPENTIIDSNLIKRTAEKIFNQNGTVNQLIKKLNVEVIE